MVRYTVELRELIESGLDIGLKDYPIWSEEHREELNKKIINHYKYREIGFETPGRFIDELNIKMHEIMPYYIKLYETTLFEYNPIHNVDYEEEHTTTRDSEGNVTNKETGTSEGSGTVTGNSESSSDSTMTNDTTNKHSNVEIDTPQSNINVSDMKNLDTAYPYASKITTDENNEQSSQSNHGTATSTDSSTTNTESTLTNDFTSDSTRNELETFKKKLKGNYGVMSSQAMIKLEREIIINIDMQIIGQLRNLFMQVW